MGGGWWMVARCLAVLVPDVLDGVVDCNALRDAMPVESVR